MKKVNTGYKENLSQKELELISLKTEFLRRNKKYQKFYDESKEDLHSQDPARFLKVIKVCTKRFGIRYPISPYHVLNSEKLQNEKEIVSYLRDFLETRPVVNLTPKLYKRQASKKSQAVYLEDSILKPNFNVLCGLSEKESSQPERTDLPIPDRKLAQTNFVQLEININCSEDVIIKEFIRIIKDWKSLKRKYQNDRRRYNPEVLREYLDIWNLKHNHPDASYKEVAKKVMKKKASEVTRNDEDRMAKAYKECCRLIDGGYKNLTL